MHITTFPPYVIDFYDIDKIFPHLIDQRNINRDQEYDTV